MNHEKTIKRIQELTGGTALEFGCKINIGYDKDVFFVKMDNEYIYWIDKEGDNCDEDTIELQHLNFEILGKPITLAVVLEAIREANVGFVFVTHSGTLHKKIGIEDTAHTYLGIWNLSKDNFNDQSEETKTFIGGLLN